MWNSWQHLWQVKAYQRLALALLFSFLLHLLLLGELGFNLPVLNQDRHLIEARLAVARPVSAKAIVEPVVKRVRTPKPVPPKPMLEPKAAAVETISPDGAASGHAPIDNQIVQTSNEPSVEPPQVEQPEETGRTINPNAYKYVETEFDVRTEFDAKVDASPAGKAKMVYQLRPNGEQYQLTSLIQAKGLLALFMPDLLQTSEGFLTKAGLRPEHYLYQFGGKKNKTFSADFDWESKKLRLNSASGVNKVALVEGAQDLLSFMYQFMFVPPLENMHLSITNGKKLGNYDYGFEGEETIATKMGNLSTIHLVRSAVEGEEKTELWLALDYRYVPVKIRKTEKEGKVYELLATSLTTEQPVTQPE
ncbi:MAG: DUF3108 domain-containing protein [Pseudomonadota bacterium]